MYSFYCELLAHDKVAAVLHNIKHFIEQNGGGGVAEW